MEPPSPKILERFLNEHKMPLQKLKDIHFLTKTSFNIKGDEKALGHPVVADIYSRTLLDGLAYTGNCYDCKYAKIERVADITLGYSWGSEFPDEEQKREVSILLIQSEKGQDLVEQADLVLLNVEIEKAVEANHQLRHPSPKFKQRDVFIDLLDKGFENAVESVIRKHKGKI